MYHYLIYFIIVPVKFSILCDENTDMSTTKLLVLVTYISPVTKQVHANLLELVSVDAKDGRAEMIYNSFKNCIIQHDRPMRNIVGLASDGANVMVSKKHPSINF